MKATTLTTVVATLCLVGAMTHAYDIRCSSEEVGIRWPSYTSNSEYFICQKIGGKVLTVTCPVGEVFTFVLQSCTSHSKYIPAPPQEHLPTSATPTQPFPGTMPHNMPYPMPYPLAEGAGGFLPHAGESMATKPVLPKPNYPTDAAGPAAPAVPAGPSAPAVPAGPTGGAPHTNDAAKPPINNGIAALPSLPPPVAGQTGEKNDMVPMPATPAPTPPVVAAPQFLNAEAEEPEAPMLNSSGKKPTQNAQTSPALGTSTSDSGKGNSVAAGIGGTTPKKTTTPKSEKKKPESGKKSTGKTTNAVKKSPASPKTAKKSSTAKSSAKNAKTGAKTLKTVKPAKVSNKNKKPAPKLPSVKTATISKV